jgi:hypothetical protein
MEELFISKFNSCIVKKTGDGTNMFCFEGEVVKQGIERRDGVSEKVGETSKRWQKSAFDVYNGEL